MTTAGSTHFKLNRDALHKGKGNKEHIDSDVETDDDKEKDLSSTEPDEPLKKKLPSSTVSKTKESKTKGKAKDGAKDEASQWKMPGLVCILVIILGIAAAWIYGSVEGGLIGSNPKTLERNRTEELRIKNEKFIQEMKSIITMLKNTESNLRFVNRSLTIFIKDEQHEKPAIFLLLGTNSSSCQLCICTWKFVEALVKYYGENPPDLSSGYIPAAELESRDNRNQQIFIENSVQQVEETGKHLIIFDDIDRYSNSSLSKMHTYLDHENAPHTNVIYILTSITANEIESKIEDQKDLQRIATKHFDYSWSQYDEDHRRALMGRMISVIGFIHKGKLNNDLFEHEDVDQTIKKKCQDKCKI